jgi:ABC-type amino acid transport substrate-binding protein
MKKKSIALILAAAIGLTSGIVSAEPKTILVGTLADNAGTSYLDAKGKLTGYEVEVLREVDRRLPEYTFEYKTMDFGNLFVALGTKKVNLINCNLQYSPERAKKFLFTNETFYASPYKLIVKKDNNTIRTLNDLNGQKIAVLGTGLQYKVLTDYVENKKLNVEILPVKSSTEIVNMLKSGRADVAFMPEFQSYVFSRYRGANLKATGFGLIPASVNPSQVGARFMFNKNDTELRDHVDRAVASMRKDGTLKKLSLQWFGKDFTQPVTLDK